MTTVRLIGPGRAGRSLALALRRVGWAVEGPLGRGAGIRKAAEGTDILVVATPDAAIHEVALAVEPVPSTLLVHLAGSLGPDALLPHRRRAAVHPLAALPDEVTGASRLVGAHYGVGGDPGAQQLVAALGGVPVPVADRDRVRYHAAACIASNHLVALLSEVERVAAGAGVPLEALLDLSRSVVDDVGAVGPAAALTGPVSRGDWKTVAAHRAVLRDDARTSYDALAEVARRLAAERRPAREAAACP